MWSVGCIFGELLGRKALFPGKDYIHQLKLIIEVLGSQQEPELAFISSQKAQAWLLALPPCPKVAWTELYPKASPMALDLLEKMLVFDPTKCAFD